MVREPEKLDVPHLVFLGEQDGPSEHGLKSQLTRLFAAEHGVGTAYLARVSYKNSPVDSVALCLRMNNGDRRGLVGKVGKVFASLFHGTVHLDIIFLNDAQEAKLADCCK